MQTIDFLRTSKWITDQYSEQTKELLLQQHMRLNVAEGDDRRRLVAAFLRATTEVAVVAERLGADPHAPSILRAFHLAPLLEREFANVLAEKIAAYGAIERDERAMHDLMSTLADIRMPWRIFSNCIAPTEKLLIPPAVSSELDFDDILTLELRYDGDINPKAEIVARVLASSDLLYATLCRILRQQEFPPMTVLFADSGSAVRFDLGGLGDPIRAAKEFLVELWNRYRHRKAEDYKANVDALLNGTKAVATLELLRQQGAITEEEFSRFKHDLLDAGTALFESGSLPREIPRLEVVPNQRILAEIQRKLLPAATMDANSESHAAETESTRKRTTKRKQSSQRKHKSK
ncbi:MAG TPA: hypothetical protein VJZ00_17220 [Thermoanaerobaculia bacterium]|nr:hypothetical protein [Thermoanaerobaculia bacterium]